MKSNTVLATLSVTLVLALTGCKSIGPSTVKRDRLHYSIAVAASRKEQLLLNIVRTRYADPPAFLEVESVVAGYSLETGVNVNGQFSPESMRGDTFAAAGVSGRYTDRPTISYSPMTGEKFARSLMSPVPLEALWFTIQGGVPADLIMGLTVQAFEGRHNLGMFVGQFQAADPEFNRLLQLMRALQQARVTESVLRQQQDRLETWINIRIQQIDPSQTVLREQLAELKQLLGIPDETNQVKVVFGTHDPEPAAVAIRTRSLLQILSTLGTGVQFAPEELGKGGIVPVDASQSPRGFAVRSGEEKPDDAFVAVPYQGQWFWIDRADLASKMTLSLVTMLFNFLEGGEKAMPVLTIPTN